MLNNRITTWLLDTSTIYDGPVKVVLKLDTTKDIWVMTTSSIINHITFRLDSEIPHKNIDGGTMSLIASNDPGKSLLENKVLKLLSKINNIEMVPETTQLKIITELGIFTAGTYLKSNKKIRLN
jgi:hypothetical protein